MDLPHPIPMSSASPIMNFDQRRSTSRTNSQTSSGSTHSNTPMAMTIPNIRHEDAPPPLPPPRYNDDLARGIDLGWSWGNQGQEMGGFRKLAPIKPGSSLYGGYMNSREGTDDVMDDELQGMDIDDDFDRRGSTVSTIRSSSQAEILDSGRHIQNGLRRPSSPAASTANQRLQGEKPLAQENFSRSSHAYDKHVLSKIGKSNSPPRHMRSDSTSGTALARKLSLETHQGGTARRSVTEMPSSATESLSRWVTSPISAGVSPGSRQGWRDYNMDYRSPSVDSLAPASALDPDTYARLREGTRPSTSGSLPGIEDSIGLVSRSKSGSYDQAFFSDIEADIPSEEAGVFRRLHLSDSNPPSLEKRPSFSTGMKRRALSPPATVARDDKLAAHALDSSQRPSAARSPTMRHQLKHGSVSSTSSSVRQNSYASSIGLSVTGSSMTSMSSSIDRFSPGGVSPSDGQVSPHTSSTSQRSPATSITQFRKPLQTSQDNKPILSARNPSTQTSMSEVQPSPTSRIGAPLICECCPKKPKKFDTADELRVHEMEKQYSCQFCHNRFKNKNEAERHQNSLHLRRHSWACSAISGYQAAFHPSTSSSQSPTGPSYDACGYCGEEFPNYPEPDWDRRVDHLTNVHKFGECNQAKKFFRADHFRQHLKHSHAGMSGKWTNMLENACMKDELPADATGGSPTGSEAGRGPSSLPPPGDTPMGGATISETQEER